MEGDFCAHTCILPELCISPASNADYLGLRHTFPSTRDEALRRLRRRLAGIAKNERYLAAVEVIRVRAITRVPRSRVIFPGIWCFETESFLTIRFDTKGFFISCWDSSKCRGFYLQLNYYRYAIKLTISAYQVIFR